MESSNHAVPPSFFLTQPEYPMISPVGTIDPTPLLGTQVVELAASFLCTFDALHDPKLDTGDQPNFTMPVLPPSTDTTPRPQPFAKK
jgi:hypothetical protein